MAMNNHEADQLLALYHETLDIEYLDRAIDSYAQTVVVAPHAYATLASQNPPLAEALFTRFECIKTQESLQDSIQSMRRATRVEPHEESDRPQRLAMLAHCLRRRFKRTGDKKDLVEAISSLKEADFMVRTRKENRLCTLIRRDTLLCQQPAGTQTVDDFKRADSVGKYTEVLGPELPALMTQLAELLVEQGKHGSDPDVDLSHAASLLMGAKRLCQMHRGMHTMVLDSFIRCSSERYEILNDIKCLDRNIDEQEQDLASLAESDPGKIDRTITLTSGLLARFGARGDLQDLERAQFLVRNVKRRIPPGHPQRANWVHHCANIEGWQFSITNNVEKIDDVVRLHKEAVELVSDTQGDAQRSHMLYIFSYWLIERHRLDGNVDDFNTAIETINESFKIAESKPRKVLYASMSANRLTYRFQSRGDERDLKHVIELLEQLVSAAPEPGQHHSALSDCYFARYRRSREPDDLDKSINHLHLGDEEEDRKTITRAALMSARGKERNERSDIDDGIEMLERMLRTLSKQSTLRSDCIYALGWALQGRYAKFHAKTSSIEYIGDLDRSIELVTEAIGLSNTKGIDTDVAQRLVLGTAYRYRSLITKNAEDEERALELFTGCLNSHTALPLRRIDGAVQAAKIRSSLSQPAEAAEVLKQAIDLLPALSLRSLPTLDQQQVVRNITGVASMAAAMALMAKSGPFHALMLLESGRNIIASLLTETRMDMSMLHPDLASELSEARHEVARLQSVTQDPSLPGITHITDPALSHQSVFEDRHAAEGRLLAIIDRIQADPKTRGFLQPPSLDELMSVLGDDHAIVINTAERRCDAFLINKRNGIQVVQLTSLTLASIEKQTEDLRLSRPYIDPSLLTWLWDDIASPILERLGLIGPCADHSLARLFWILTGPLTHLPIHAAGRHTDRSRNTVMDRAMSTYCSSLRGFVHSRKVKTRPLNHSKEGPVAKALLVAMDVTPGLKSLPYATEEIDMVEKQCSLLNIKPLRLKSQTRHQVLAELGSQIFHFAGHGRSDPLDPSKSGLFLHDALLTVANLREHNFGDNMPFLAYLSACLTAANDVKDLVDEGIHLLGACQLAGFRHLIGTLWQVHDNACVKIAEDVYKSLATNKMSDHSVCAALHRALVCSRNNWISGQSSAAAPPVAGSISQKSSQLGGIVLEGDTKNEKKDVHRDGTLKSGKSGSRVKADWVPYVHYGP
ncbi:hypothetical protein NM208_g4680 [Fusarium decemcellulare]|uniref:Uncharacterized protein n=2 Tax=Fusarium decemcellulare TaxID=57161 RepID=A0ACC1SJN2_9HYPO|nr:hypothetical protein NM208_g5766 [Fusarium decemcellulare]KAJ3541285.1 hypothetical protein NM208_g4680 [Fusarium decemcellulare]